jgi:hypothetical protein
MSIYVGNLALDVATLRVYELRHKSDYVATLPAPFGFAALANTLAAQSNYLCVPDGASNDNDNNNNEDDEAHAVLILVRDDSAPLTLAHLIDAAAIAADDSLQIAIVDDARLQEQNSSVAAILRRCLQFRLTIAMRQAGWLRVGGRFVRMIEPSSSGGDGNENENNENKNVVDGICMPVAGSQPPRLAVTASVVVNALTNEVSLPVTTTFVRMRPMAARLGGGGGGGSVKASDSSNGGVGGAVDYLDTAALRCVFVLPDAKAKLMLRSTTPQQYVILLLH